jgi:hypothetical protein
MVPTTDIPPTTAADVYGPSAFERRMVGGSKPIGLAVDPFSGERRRKEPSGVTPGVFLR